MDRKSLPVSIITIDESNLRKGFRKFESFIEGITPKERVLVDLPDGAPAMAAWRESIGEGRLFTFMAEYDGKLIGTSSVIRASLPWISSGMDINIISGYDITATYVLPGHRRQGVYNDHLCPAAEGYAKKLAGNRLDVFRSVTNVDDAYDATGPVLERLLNVKLERFSEVELFVMFELLEGKKLTPEEFGQLQPFVGTVSAEAQPVLSRAKRLVAAGQAEPLGLSLDGMEDLFRLI